MCEKGKKKDSVEFSKQAKYQCFRLKGFLKIVGTRCLVTTN
jgi:hypothetical protein